MKTQKFLRGPLVVAAAALLLGACASNEPPGYARGWADGCTSGHHDGHDPGSEYRSPYLKDEGRYDSNAQYHRAWDDAYARCRVMPYMMMIGQRPETGDRGVWEVLS